MIIKVNDKEIEVTSVISTSISQNSKKYPALEFVFDGEIKAEDVESLTSGSFSIGEDVHEGYNTLNKISMVIGKITTAEQERDELEKEFSKSQEALANTQQTLATTQQEKTELQEALSILLEGGN